MKPLGVDLLIVDYKSPDDLARCLESIDPPAELDVAVWVGVVDSPDSRDVARTYFEMSGRPGDVVSWAENVGYNRALNLLGTLGNSEVIGCLNADVALTREGLPELAVATVVNESWGVVGPRQRDSRGRLTAGGIFGKQTEPRHRGWHARDGYEDVRDDCVYVAGSALFLRRTVWDELTGCLQYRNVSPDASGPWLDTQHFYGDSYLSLHAQAHGYAAAYLGTTTIIHECGAQANRTRDDADRARFRDACDAHGIEHE